MHTPRHAPPVPRRRGWLGGLFMLCFFMAAAGHAQSVPSDDDASADPPDRVARLSYLAGDVGFLPSGARDWSDASVNRPLTAGDKLSTQADARAELELGGGALRIDGGTDFGFLDLNDQLAQVELTQGTLNLSVRSLAQGQSYEIDTPTLALVVDQPGTFRVDVSADGRSTQVTAFDGNAVVFGENDARRDVVAGRSYRFDNPALDNASLQDIGGGDAFDQWCSSRDRRYAGSTSSQYVSEDVVGYQDLDDYGAWQADDDYGEVWYPAHVAADWAPYRDGHWAYVAPWGWTWVDDLPWGFAPYHYGRWAYVRSRGAWGWIPGPRGVRSIYAPALVAFVGGGRWSVSIGIGAGAPVGWFPLGPGEIYNPWYRASHRYYTRVNESNLRWRHGDRSGVLGRIDDHYRHYRLGQSMPNAHYANREAPRGFTAVSGRTFTGAHRVQHDLLRVDPHQLGMAPVLARGNGLRPTAQSLARPRATQAHAWPDRGFQRAVVARHAPATPANRPHGLSPGNMATSWRAGTPANVHILGREPGGRHIDSTQPMQSQPPRTTAVRSAADHAQPDHARPYRTQPALRPGELPSARFAHGRADAGHQSGAQMQRYDNRRPAAMQPDTAAPRTLPQPPRFQSASPSRTAGDNAPRATQNRPQWRTSSAPASLPTTPRFEQMQRTERPSSTSFRSEQVQRFPRSTPTERPAASPARTFQPRPMPGYSRPAESRPAPAGREHAAPSRPSREQRGDDSRQKPHH